jgi:hypothetical protein
MPSPLAWAGQIVAYAAFGVGIGYLSLYPAYTHRDPEQAQIKLSFAHAGVHKEDCRRLSYEEISKMPPGQRRPHDCSRERVPVTVELEVDGQVLYAATLPPTGHARDGVSVAYQRFMVAAGRHELIARLRDSKRAEGFDYEHRAQIELAPRQNLAIEFRADKGGFLIH